MPYGYYGFYWMDYTYIFVIIGAVICLIASAGMNSTFSRYQRVRSMSGMTGAMAAERILRDAGIHEQTENGPAGSNPLDLSSISSPFII